MILLIALLLIAYVYGWWRFVFRGLTSEARRDAAGYITFESFIEITRIFIERIFAFHFSLVLIVLAVALIAYLALEFYQWESFGETTIILLLLAILIILWAKR